VAPTRLKITELTEPAPGGDVRMTSRSPTHVWVIVIESETLTSGAVMPETVKVTGSGVPQLAGPPVVSGIGPVPVPVKVV
jgi:hypothetical protein